MGEVGTLMPFTAVKLHSVPTDAKLLKAVQSNRYLFIRANEEVKAFAFSKEETANPHWFTLYATNQGRLRSGHQFEVQRMEWSNNNRLVARKYDAQVVAQLRYEYALNLAQKLGTFLTRVGLDFAN
jgi:hypothetical protein